MRAGARRLAGLVQIDDTKQLAGWSRAKPAASTAVHSDGLAYLRP